MGGISGKPADVMKRVFKSFHHSVEGNRKSFDFIAGWNDWETLVKIS